MFRNRMFALLGALLLLGGLAVPVSAAEVESGSVYCFSPEDFAGEETLAGICITDLPDTGAFLLGTRVLREGDILTAEQVAQMTFAPLDTEVDAAAEVGYLPIYDSHVASSAAMTIAIRGKEDKAPIAEDQALETYKNLPNTTKLKATDPEGQALTYTVTRQPKRGTVSIAEDGTMTYTPKKNKVGVDSFVYTATDPAGKVSREATVTITILKPTDATQYTDTVGKDCRFAAEWMKNTGIFVGETVASNACFSPEKEVTRGEFVTMLAKALELPIEEEAAVTGYTDDIPAWLRPYLAAAIRSGLTAGLPDQETFGADTPITGAEAAVMLQNALDLSGGAASGKEVPVWAETALTALSGSGIHLDANAPLTRADAAQVLYQTAALYHAEKSELF
ncbi:MAG: S-layer homology domain-containing protein [Oscillospiraceae bacterium]|nr:S-layer homology domain-containing protein [Oscillospiraceae bacterium]